MASRRDVRYVVVQDVSRFARNLCDQTQTIEQLYSIGVLVRSTYESNIDETASGRLSANMLGGINQYYSDSLSEKMRDRTFQSASAGRFPWPAPIGYVNTGGKSGANIVPDEGRAPLIRKAFELMATARYKKSEVLNILTDDGLRTRGGKPLTKQTLQAVLKNSLYAGWVTMRSRPDFEPVPGLHDAIVTQDAFDRVQAILDGRKPSIVAKQKVNPVVPLRGFIRCDACGTPITGGSPKGRGGKAYPRYWCNKSGCRAVTVAKSQFEEEFVHLLQQLRPSAHTVSNIPKVAARVWKDAQGDSEREMTKLNGRLEMLKQLKSGLLRMKVLGQIAQEDFEEERANLTVETYEIDERLREVAAIQATTDSFVRFAELQAVDMANLWDIARPEQKVRVQNLLFGDGLAYSPETGFLNRSKSSLFLVLGSNSGKSECLVGPPGLEPGTSGL
jgi:site-specific DNA recombinase